MIDYKDLKKAETEVGGEVDSLEELSNLLVSGLIDSRSCGVSANMLGVDRRAIIVGNFTDASSYLPMFNPRIVNKSDEIVKVVDNCPLFKNAPMEMKRHKEVKVRFMMVTGETITHTFGGQTAAIIQRLIDALDGITIKSKVNRYHFSKAMKKGVDKEFLPR